MTQAFILAVLTALLMALGQIFFKKAAILNADSESTVFLIKYLKNYWFLLAIFIFGVATVVWVKALSKSNLSTLYPVLSLAFVMVPLMSIFLFKEKLSVIGMIGVATIVVGVILMSRA